MLKKIYLDNNSHTRPLASALEKLFLGYKEKWGDFSSFHHQGQDLTTSLKESLDCLYEHFGADQEDLFFFSASLYDTLSSIFTLVYSQFIRETGRNHFLILDGEKTDIVHSAKKLEPMGCALKLLPPNKQGQLTRSILEEHLSPRSALLSLSWANGLTGVVQPIFDLAQLCKEKDILLHVDASYALGKLFFRLQDFSFNFITFDGALLHAPQGTGGVFALNNKGLLTTFKETSRINIPALLALADAVNSTFSHFDHLCTETARLRDKLEKGVQQIHSEAQVFFQEAERLPHCTAIAFPGIHNEALLYHLHRKGIYATCGGGRFPKLSEHLMHCGIDAKLAHSALSFALSYETTEQDVDYTLEVLSDIIKKSQNIFCLEGKNE